MRNAIRYLIFILYALFKKKFTPRISFIVFSFLFPSPAFSAAEERPFTPTIHSVTIEGASAFSPKQLLSQMQSIVGAQFDTALIVNDIEMLLHWYENNGYPFTKINVESCSLYTGETKQQLSLVLSLEEGPLVYIESFRVEGNTVTQSDIILREINFRRGEMYNHKKIERIPRKLERLAFFSSIGEPKLFVNENGGILQLNVQEGKFNSFDGVLGILPASQENATTITGMINIGMRNLFGTGRNAAIYWHRENALTQELSLRYVEPWLFSSPLNASVGFFQRKQDSSYVKRSTDLKLELPLNDDLAFNLVFSQETVTPSETNTSTHRSTSTFVGAEINYDTRNRLNVPTSGGLARLQIDWGSKSFYGTEKSVFSVRRFTSDVEQYFSTVSRQIIATSIHSREIQSKVLGISDLFQFGGATSLRGYREKQFSASRIVWSNTEYRLLLSEKSFTFVFFDAGYLYHPPVASLVRAQEDFLFGYGVGVLLETQAGNLGVSFALGEGDTFSRMKIHVQLINQF